MEKNYTIEELEAMLAEAKENKRKSLEAEKEMRHNEVEEAYNKYIALLEKFNEDYGVYQRNFYCHIL